MNVNKENIQGGGEEKNLENGVHTVNRRGLHVFRYVLLCFLLLLLLLLLLLFLFFCFFLLLLSTKTILCLLFLKANHSTYTSF